MKRLRDPGKIWVLALAPLVKPAAASSQQAAPSRLRLYRTPIAVRALVDPPCVSPAASPEDIEEPRARRKEKQMRERVHVKKVMRSSTDMKDSKDVHSADT